MDTKSLEGGVMKGKLRSLDGRIMKLVCLALVALMATPVSAQFKDVEADNVAIQLNHKSAKASAELKLYGPVRLVWETTGEFHDDEYRIQLYQKGARLYDAGEYGNTARGSSQELGNAGLGGYKVQFQCHLENRRRTCDKGRFNWKLINCGCPTDRPVLKEACFVGNVANSRPAVCEKEYEGAIAIPSRTEKQRQDMCEHSKDTMEKWENRDPNTLFAVNLVNPRTRGHNFVKGCRGLPGNSNVFNIIDCRNAKEEWQWRPDNKLELRRNGQTQTNKMCFGRNDFVIGCNTNDHAMFPAHIMPRMKPAVCPCGFDFGVGNGECEDIDECKEKHACPASSTCVNTEGDYECRCKDEYGNFFNFGRDVERDSKCVTVPIMTASEPTSDSFRMTITNVVPGNVYITVLQISEFAADLEVPVPKFKEMVETFSGKNEVKEIDFAGLQPGGRFKVSLTYIDNSDPSRVVTGYSTTSEEIVTKCYCDILGDDETGRPDNLVAIQENGFVMFNFRDNSRCEEAYAFSRTHPASRLLPEAEDDDTDGELEESVFTSDYYSFSAQQCSNEAYAPGHQAADDLRLSKLTVGDTYEYHILAAAKQPWKRSNPASVLHTVLWQSSVEGQVTLKPTAGAIPVEKVIVEYRLEDNDGNVIPNPNCQAADDAWCRVETSPSGKFLLGFSLNHAALNNNDDYPLHLRFAKRTGTIDHQFLCNDGTTDCSFIIDAEQSQEADDSKPQQTATAYLRHLEFGIPVKVYDDTTIPFRGRLGVAGTEMPGAGFLGCPILGAEVCLVDHASRNKIKEVDPTVCVETDATGEYALPAVIGTLVSPIVRYHEHVFQPFNLEHIALFEEGILIEPDGAYEGFNLQDLTKTKVTIEVAGGLCNRLLGETDIRVTLPGCEWEGEVVSQSRVSRVHEVPAHVVKLEVDGVKGISDGSDRRVIRNALNPAQNRVVDLRDLEEEDELENKTVPIGLGSSTDANSTGLDAGSEEEIELEEAEAEDKSKTDVKRIRFQFDGTDQVRVLFGDMNTGTCGSDAASEGVQSYSAHVVPSFTGFLLNVFVHQYFGFDDIQICSVYPANSTVSIINQVGVVDTQSDRVFVEKLQGNAAFAEVARALKACNPSCTHELVHDERTGENAHLSIALMSGQPNPFNALTKPLFVTVDETGVRHKADVFVTGDFDLGDGFSVALPTHKPLLTLRDPPGGGSYSYFENVHSTIKLEMEDYKNFVGFDVTGNHGFGAYTEVEACYGAGGLSCLGLVEHEAHSNIHGAGGTDFMVSHVHRDKSARFSTTWSYSTSSDQWLAGKLSDVFLVPSLNAKFKDVTEVEWLGPELCAKAENDLKFALDSPDNKPAIAFLSRFDVDHTEIPDLKRLKADAEKDLKEFNCPNSADPSDKSIPDECRSAIVTRDIMGDAVRDWETFLERHDNVTRMAATGELEGIEPNNWFKRIRDASDDAQHLPKEHYSGLVPKTLEETAQRLRGTSSSEELERINLIKFDGGGSELKFQLKNNILDQDGGKDGPTKQNMNQNVKVGAWGDTDFKGLLSFNVILTLDLQEHGDYHHTQTKGNEEATEIGFVLKDSNVGDVFDVEVTIDPDFGTFIFNTVGGRSKCPVEENTIPRELPHIQLKSGPSVPGHPDEPLLFEVELTNQGIDSSSFELWTDHRSNRHLIGHLANGDTLTVPQQYPRIDPGETVITTVAVTRGPAAFDNPSLPLIFRSACEGMLNVGDGNNAARGITQATSSIELFNVVDASQEKGDEERIRFAEPCPKIEFGGDLALDRSFTVNLASEKKDSQPAFTVPIVVRNPESSFRSYAQAVADPLARLGEAGLWYRRVGSFEWDRALHRPLGSDTSVPIQLTELPEDDFGYILVDWDMEALGDGEYEIEARTICPDVTGTLPTDFNFASTSRIKGSIDRIAPELFGKATPIELNPGEAVEFEFTEAIDCAGPHVFEIKVTAEAFPDRIFDNTIHNNLHVICEDRSIRFSFDAFQVDLTELMGSSAVATLTGVLDLNGNPIDPFKPIEHQFEMAAVQVESVGFEGSLSTTAGGGGGGGRNRRLSTNDLQSMVSEATSISTEEISVQLREGAAKIVLTGPNALSALAKIGLGAGSGDYNKDEGDGVSLPMARLSVPHVRFTSHQVDSNQNSSTLRGATANGDDENEALEEEVKELHMLLLESMLAFGILLCVVVAVVVAFAVRAAGNTSVSNNDPRYSMRCEGA